MAEFAQNLFELLHDKKWVEAFKKTKRHDFRVALLRNYNIQDQKEEAVIQLLINKFDPPKPSVTHIDQVRAEMALDEAKGPEAEHPLDTPEGEEYWQAKLDQAQVLDDADFKKELKARYAEIKKVLPDVELPKEPGQTPTITVNPQTKKATVQAPAESQKSTSELADLPGMNDETILIFDKAGIKTKEELFKLTYAEALNIARTPLVLANIKDKFAQKSQGEVNNKS